jgi:poly(3-hydroxybutyrate) depolymerase
MTSRKAIVVVVLLIACPVADGAGSTKDKWWPAGVEQALAKAKDNRPELEKALAAVPHDQRKGMAFLIANMPDTDLLSLKADFLLSNTELAYKARNEVAWGKDIPEEIFLNNVLPYANVDEERDAWRKEFYDLCMPIAKTCKTPAEAAQKLNSEVFKKVKVQYSTQRKKPNQSPKESIEQGKASCTGLSIILSDACRAVCIPARLVGTPLWANKSGNHTWVEIWDKEWHFTGACEQDPNGLDRGWFVGNAAQAKKDSFEHAIYAASFQKTTIHFPLVWAMTKLDVPAENVTDHYTKKAAPKSETVHVMIRVMNATKKRLAVPVTVTEVGQSKAVLKGMSRAETADMNDFLSFDLQPGQEYVIKAAGVEKTIKTGAAGGQLMVDLLVTEPPPGAAPKANKSAAALKALQAALADRPPPLGEVAAKEFAKVPLTKADAAAARELLWKAHVAIIQHERADEIKNRVLKDGNLEMPFDQKIFGKKPGSGRSLWISLHGGGGAPKQVNDSQWENQKKLYTVEEGIYLAPRAPTNTWNLWHEAHIDRLFGRLIEDLIVLEDVNPERVYVLGYSAGGDGVYQLAPRMADYWAAAAMMAGHPNGVSMLSLRNVPFALQVGANDSAYNRNKVAKEYGEQLDKLQQDDPQGYEHFVKIHEGKGHWMDLQDKAALPWMAKFNRNSTPDRVVWKQTGVPHDRSYWLAVPTNQMKADSLIIAKRDGQTVHITAAEKVATLLIRFDDRMADLDQPITVTHAGKNLFVGTPARTIEVLIKTLVGRGDPKLVFDAEVVVNLPSEK